VKATEFAEECFNNNKIVIEENAQLKKQLSAKEEVIKRMKKRWKNS